METLAGPEVQEEFPDMAHQAELALKRLAEIRHAA
jgi:hypothetical protein